MDEPRKERAIRNDQCLSTAYAVSLGVGNYQKPGTDIVRHTAAIAIGLGVGGLLMKALQQGDMVSSGVS